MNLNNLEKLARQALKGDVTEKGNEMVKGGFITPAEHRSLKSLSWQIAANLQADSTAGTYAYKGIGDTWWM